MRCGLARCPGAKSTRFSVILVVSFSHVHAISSRLQCNCADLPSGCWVPTLPTQYAGYQRIKSTYSWTSKNSWTPFFLGGGWSWRWCWFPLHWLELGFRIIYKYPSFITSNYRIQQILFILNALQKSKHNSLRRSFSSSDNSFGTIFAQTILMFNSSLRIRRTLSLSILTSSATARTPNLWSFKSRLTLFQSCHR